MFLVLDLVLILVIPLRYLFLVLVLILLLLILLVLILLFLVLVLGVVLVTFLFLVPVHGGAPAGAAEGIVWVRAGARHHGGAGHLALVRCGQVLLGLARLRRWRRRKAK